MSRICDSATPELFVVGVAEAYLAAILSVDKLALTLVDAEPPRDTVFPQPDRSQWRGESRDTRDCFAFVGYLRAGDR